MDKKMKYFKKVSMLLIALLVVSMVAGACATQNIDDNSKTCSTKIDDTTKTKIIYVAINGKDTNDGLSTKNPKRTIQNAINTAKIGDSIEVAQGTYKENLQIGKNIKIKGSNQKHTIIDGQQKTTGISINNGCNVTLTGFTIQKGKIEGSEGYGGGISNEGTLSLIDSTITNNNAQYGGGIDNGGIVTLVNSTITNNTADYGTGGGIDNKGGMVTLVNSKIINNTAYYGGGISNFGRDRGLVTSINSTIANNYVYNDGGGIYNVGTITLQNTKITYNNARGKGGGIFSNGKLNYDLTSQIKNNTPNDISPTNTLYVAAKEMMEAFHINLIEPYKIQ